MKEFLSKLNKLQKIVLLILILVGVYFLFDLLKSKIIAHNFFKKYNVQTVLGNDTFAYNAIALNGSTTEKTKEEWTNVLPIPNSLKYLKLTNSYSKGKPIQCGDNVIPKKVEQYRDGENEWCINYEDKNYTSISSPVYFHYDTENIVYEKCLKNSYYEGFDGTSGYNGCAERKLYINDKEIASSKEKYVTNSYSGITRLEDSSSFNYYPSKKIGSQIIYSTDSASYSYNLETQETKILNVNDEYRLDDVIAGENGELVLIKEYSTLKNTGILLGTMEYKDKNYQQIYSVDYINGNLYILRLIALEDRKEVSSSKIAKFELIINDKKEANIEIDGGVIWSYESTAIRQFPLCDTDTIVCIYEDGHYAYKNRTLAPDVFGYDFYTDEMVIDGEWRGDNIPNLIGRSKPIFEGGKLRYIVHVGFPDNGLYLIDLNKKWDFKSLYNKTGPATTKLLGGYQNKLLNVLVK